MNAKVILGESEKAKKLAKGCESQYTEEIMLRFDRAELSLKREIETPEKKNEVEMALTLTTTWLRGTIGYQCTLWL